MAERLELTASGRTVSLSSPDKPLVRGVTKRQLAEHWLLAGPCTTAAVGGRLVSAKRAPDGPDGDAFFQKHVPRGMPGWLRTFEVPRERDDGTVQHVVLDDVAHLLALTQFGTVEVHVTTWDVEDPWAPRELLLDLDPPEDGPTDLVRGALRHTLALCDDLELPWRVKTTGSKGFHVHVPVHDVDQQATRDAAELLAAELVRRHPDALTTEFKKDDRGGRVLVDWWRNGGGATAVAPWSPRIADGGPVAMPLRAAECHGDALTAIEPAGWLVEDVPGRLEAGDPWAAVVTATDLTHLADALGG